MSKIIINGRSFTVEGPLSMRNGKWYDGMGHEIDMKNLAETKEAKTINITIEGNVDKLDIDHCNNLVINGDCKKVKTTSGDIKCGDISGDAETVSGDIECEVIQGDANTVSGNIRSNEIKGRASTTSGKVNGERRYGSHDSASVNNLFGSIFGNTTSEITAGGDVISGSFNMIRTADGKKHMTLNKDCTVNGRRIGDMSQEEIRQLIADMAKKNKIVTII